MRPVNDYILCLRNDCWHHFYLSDINECIDEDLYNCTDEFHKCVNTRGSYKCECDQNLYFIDGKCRGNGKSNFKITF